MIDTRTVRTQQEIIAKRNMNLPKKWVLGIDAGFSSLKGFAPTKYFCFPSFAHKLDTELQFSNEQDILYRDDSGTYLVGASAQNQIGSDDTNETETELYARNRYSNKKFKIILATGLAIGISENLYGKKSDEQEIVVQTGLPTAYIMKDEKSIVKAFCDHYVFELKIGMGNWKKYDIQVKPENVFVMPQPAGTLYSVVVDENGHNLPDAKAFFSKNILIADVGFGTFDPYGLINRKLVLKESLSNIGMRRILAETSGLIRDLYGEDIRVPAMQKYLEKGYIDILDEETMKTESVQIAPLLEKASEMVFQEAVAALKNMTNFIRDYDVLIPTGGTCSLWMDKFVEHFKDMKSLTVIPGNRNDKLPLLYSNVRGYYMFCYMSVKAGV